MNGWHLDKRVPIALILALGLQTFGIVWWAATINSRVDVLEAWTAKRPDFIPQNIGARVVVLETKFDSILRVLNRIENKLDKRP